MGVTKNYRIITKAPFDTFKSPPHSMMNVLKVFLNILSQYKALNMYDAGCFIETKNPFTGDTVCKKYVLEINIPHTIIEIRKLDKGSINEDVFMSTLQIIKEKYYDERI